ncbi:NTPase [Desulfonema ishimotonii]|uniref:NTPase n=1 Tax=Desulfonema ishimotonii TaxID=45657 RepID=A0A401FZK8_9BACT|nr:NACHT domain-containing protein [Desulfonema ishimotonii]GBC62405.1 NTPase [Desulfonema ishimotonii]
MIAEWLAAWGVKSAVGFAFEKVLAPLAQDASKYWVRNFCGKVLTNVIEQPKKRELKKAAGLAIREFLVLFQQELEDADLSDDDLIMFEEPLKYYVQEKAVLEILGGPLQPEFEGLDVAELNSQWENLKTRPPGLPEDFDWQNIAKRYPRKVKAILRESEVLRNLLNALHQEESADSLRQIAGVSPDFDLQKYREGLLERYGNLNLESLDATGAYYELKLWGVFIAQTVRECREYLPRVYEMPKEVQARLKKTGEMPDDLSEQDLERFQKAYQEQPVRPVPEAIEDPQNKYMVVLGDPGSGKSTLLQYLALEWAREPLRERSLEPLPLLIELRTYARDCENGVCNDILSFCHTGNVCCRLNDLELKKQLDAGNVVALFDGLDEVFDPARREDVITAIHRFSNDYPNVRIMVTSRVIGYKPQKLKDAEFRHFMLQDLDEEQVEEFISKWHDLTFTEEWEKERKRDRLKRAIADSSAIRQLAGNPLLLTMMAILNRNQELPRDRAELYHQCSRLLLHQWDIERQLVDKELDYKAVDYKDKQAMLRRVAFFMQDSEKGLAGNLIYKDDLERILREYLKEMDVREPRKVARLLIEQLRVRNFILCHVGADWYAFVHRTFLEYFCAWEFVWRFEKERKLSFEKLRDEVYGAHWADEKWHEVLRLIAGMIEAGFVGRIIEYLMKQDGESEKFVNLFLAAECLGEVRNRNIIGDIDDSLKNKVKSLVQYSFTDFLLFFEICQKTVAAVSLCWEKEPDTLSWLKHLTTEDYDDVRYVAIQELVLSWKNVPAVYEILCNCALKDPFERLYGSGKMYIFEDNPRQTALEALTQHFPERPHTRDLLQDRAQNDPDEQVREYAAKALERLNQDSQDDEGVSG